MFIFSRHSLLFVLFLFFTGCAHNQLDTKIKNPSLPSNFNNNNVNIALKENWLSNFNDKELLDIVNIALNNNFELKQLGFDVKIKQQELIATNSLLFPSLDFGINTSKDGEIGGSSDSTSLNASLDLSYEVDLWGKLSDSKRSANMDLLQTKALYEEAKQELISNVSLLYYKIIESNKLLDLYKKNLLTSKQSYELTLSRYKQGLSEALDTLLAKNSIYTQELKISNLQTTKSQAIYQLEQLLSNYPSGKLDINKDLPLIKEKANIGIPSELIERKASITASWNALLSKDYTLAFTHKQRLPSLSISASLENIKDDGLPTLWSLAAGITAPIFNAGKLKANEQIAYYELKKAEQEYLKTVFDSLTEIETYIQEEKNLKNEYEILKTSNENAKKSLELSFNQYLKGLIEYSTVLDLQESFYNTQSSIIQMKASIIQNSINLHKALGGDFLPKDYKEDKQ